MKTTGRQRTLFDLDEEVEIVSLAVALGAKSVGCLHDTELALTESAETVPDSVVKASKTRILKGQDPLGDLFTALKSQRDRRRSGAIYTPQELVGSILARIGSSKHPARIIDPGCGSARFLLQAGNMFPESRLVGFDIDPLATLMARANLAVLGFAERSQIFLADYCSVSIPEIDGLTAFVGNPPYVRHHQISADRKEWLLQQSAKLGLKASALAGLHVYFYLSTALHGKEGDLGTFITSSEWLDVNYGSLVRDLFLGTLGGRSITVIEPTAEPFPDTASTATITAFEIGKTQDMIRVARVETVAESKEPQYQTVKRERFESEARWSHLTRVRREVPAGFIELGELCRVHRGSVTGSNKVWIAGSHSEGLPDEFLYPCVTRAKELFEATTVLVDSSGLRCVIDLPGDLSNLDRESRKVVDKFLKYAKALATDEGYIARTRKAWWSVGLRQPAPILATYMARRPPRFVVNLAEARHINIAHGLYPREPMSEDVLKNIALYLSSSTSMDSGRTYAGGLTKFEPREMERLLIPQPEELANYI